MSNLTLKTYQASATWMESLEIQMICKDTFALLGHSRVANCNSICHTQYHLSQIPEGSMFTPQEI